MTSSYSNQY